MKVKAEDVRVGMGLKMWFGNQTVMKINQYKGTFGSYVLNILVFSNGMKMSNTKGHLYEMAEF